MSPGGTVAYAMTGPEGDRHRGVWRVRAVDPPHMLEVEDALADADGTPSPDKPAGVIRIALSEPAGGGTQMVITVAWASDAAMEWMLATGTDAGMTAAVGADRRAARPPGANLTALEENIMTATYTFDVFSTLDGFGSYNGGDWGGYWSKQGPEFLDHRLALYGEEQRMVLGANTFRQFVELLGPGTEESDLRRPADHPDEDHADDGGVDDARRTPRLAGRDPRER